MSATATITHEIGRIQTLAVIPNHFFPSYLFNSSRPTLSRLHYLLWDRDWGTGAKVLYTYGVCL